MWGGQELGMHLLENLPGYVSHELGGEIKAIFTHKPHITVLTFQEEVSYMLSLEGQMPHSSLAFILSLPIRPLLFLLPPGQVCLLLFPLFFTSSLSFSLSLANYPECRMSDLIFTQFRVHFLAGGKIGCSSSARVFCVSDAALDLLGFFCRGGH